MFVHYDRRAYLLDVKKTIRGLLVSSREPLSVKQLEEEFTNTTGEVIPYDEYGYPDTALFLRDMPEFVRLVGAHGARDRDIIVQPVLTEKNKHIRELIDHQKKTVKPKKEKKIGPGPQKFMPMILREAMRKICLRHGPRGLPLNTIDVELSKELGLLDWKQSGVKEWYVAYGFQDKEELIKLFIELNLIRTYFRNDTEYATCLTKPRHLGPKAEFEEVDSSEQRLLRNNLKMILNANPEGVRASDFGHEFRVTHGYELDLAKRGYINVVEMAHHLKDIFYCRKTDDQSDWILSDRNNVPDSETPAAAEEEEELPESSVIPEDIMERLTYLMITYPRGIVKNSFLKAYKDYYDEYLQFIDYGFTDLNMLFNYLAERDIVYVKKVGSIEVICHPLMACEDIDPDTDLTKDGLMRYYIYPKIAMGHREKLPEQDVYSHFVINENVDVLVTEVINPNDFWVRLWSDKEMSKLMESLQQYYTKRGPLTHEMPIKAIRVGLYIAARMPEKVHPQQPWCRGLITGMPADEKVEVMFVDYGTKSKLLFSELRFLDKKFSTLPMLAYRLSLFKIRPVGYGQWLRTRNTLSIEDAFMMKPLWSKEARLFFRNTALGQPGVAQVIGIYSSKSTISVTLANTNGAEDFWYNDTMVSQNLAEWGTLQDGYEVHTNDHMSHFATRFIIPFKGNTKELASDMGSESESETVGFLERFLPKCRLES